MPALDPQILTQWSRRTVPLPTQRTTRLLSLAFIALLVVQADSCGTERNFGLDDQEFLCDEAAGRIRECCGHSAGLYCTREYGCNHRSPDLTAKEGLCLLESSCEALQAAGVCAITTWKPYGSSSPPTGSRQTTDMILQALQCH